MRENKQKVTNRENIYNVFSLLRLNARVRFLRLMLLASTQVR